MMFLYDNDIADHIGFSSSIKPMGDKASRSAPMQFRMFDAAGREPGRTRNRGEDTAGPWDRTIKVMFSRVG
jgi:hypothetical protein